MTQSYEMAGRNVASNLAEKQPHELLLLLGGALAILLSVMLYAIQWAQGGIPASRLASETTTFVIVLVLGAALWASAAVSRKNLMNGAIVAGVVSIVLIAYGGGLAGTIGGVIGLLGAILAAANPYLPWSRHT
ncbi:MAG TPA: hypothetical protein VJP06_00220 [Thermoplasmata archaeon]|nr:hypothetical protein [Thermoplasmata archaeon]